MRFAAAIFFALAVVAAQVAHGGLMMPFLAYPAYALAGLGAICALPAVFAAPRQPWPSLMIATVALFAYVLWRCGRGPDHSYALVDAALALACAAVWAGMSLAVTRNDARFVFFSICLAAACAQAVVAVVQLATHGEFSMPFWFSDQLHGIYAARFPNRARGLFMNPNHFAWLMNVMALLSLSLGIWGRLKLVPRIGLLYLAAVFGVLTVFSASRGGTVSLLAGFSVFMALSLAAVFVAAGSRRILLLVVGVVLLAICAGAGYAAFSTSWVAQGRMDTLLQGDVRSGFVEDAFRLFQVDPLLGAGPGMYRYAARFFRTGSGDFDTTYAHDDWLQFLAEYGFVGTAIFVLALLLALVAATRGFLALVRIASAETASPMSSSGAFVLGSACGLVASAVHGNVDFNMHIPANALMAAALLGLVTGARPLGIGRKATAARPFAWIAAAAAISAAAGLAWLIAQRGEGEYRSLQAGNALARGDANAAIEASKKGLQRLPGDPLLLAQQGQGLFDYDAWLEASSPDANSAADADDDDSDKAPEGAGDDSGKAGDAQDQPKLSDVERAKYFRESAESYAQAVKLQPLERTHRVGWAKALAETGDDAAAQREYREAIALDPLHAYAWASYGDYLYNRDRIADARRIYEIAASLPGGQHAWNQMTSIDEDAAPEKEEEGNE